MTKRETLPPDPKAVEKWEQLPQNRPSKDALPPLTGGLQWTWGLLIVMFVLIVLALIIAGRVS